MAQALINENRFTSRGIGSGLRRRVNPIRSFSSRTQEPDIYSYLPITTQLAFQRKDIPGKTYASIVEQSIEKAIPGSTAYNQLLREENKAIIRARQEAEAAYKAQVKAAGGSYSKAYTQYKNQVVDAIRQTNDYYEQIIKEIKSNKENFGVITLQNGDVINEQAYLLKRIYKEWNDKLGEANRIISQDPTLVKKLPQSYKPYALKSKARKILTDSQVQDKYLKSSPSILANVVNDETGKISVEIAAPDLKQKYIQDEYGLYHKVDFIENADGTYQAVATILNKDGVYERIVSDGTFTDKKLPEGVTFKTEDGSRVITNLGNYDPALQGRYSLQGVNVASPEFIQKVLNVTDPNKIRELSQNLVFQQIKAENPAAAEFISPEFSTQLNEQSKAAIADNFGGNDFEINKYNADINNNITSYNKLRSEGLLEGNAAKLNQATQTANIISNLLKSREAEIARNKPLKIVTPEQLQRIDEKLPPPAKKGRIVMPDIVNVQSALGQGVKTQLGPSKASKPLTFNKSVKMDKSGNLTGVSGPYLPEFSFNEPKKQENLLTKAFNFFKGLF